MPTVAEKAERFRELHARPGTFIIPNPFDIGSARILQHLGFEALATTSSGFAFTLGRRDYAVTRDEAIGHEAHRGVVIVGAKSGGQKIFGMATLNVRFR